MSALPESVLIKLTDTSPGVQEDLAVRTVLLSPSNSFKVQIGRASQLHQQLPDKQQRLARSDNALFQQRGISRIHGYFIFDNGSLWYEDGKSRNGTKVVGRGLVTHKIRLSSKEGIASKLVFAPNLSSSQSLTLSIEIVKIVYKKESKLLEKENQATSDLKPRRSDILYYQDEESNDESAYRRRSGPLSRSRKRLIDDDEEEEDDEEVKKPKKKQKKTDSKPSEAWSFTAGIFAGSLCTLATLVAIGASSST
ncbi:hypothetical protein D0Z00_003000 [Geotrichum galactomycetum]|uniref:Uncharacterized protein n=1 Tax=Geotrichum galactomycetum TaxID=27317 RepID=A0ACB6V2G4_9ASCO|nr:hypothetical protein D0Z00_003000 [Geotrichum candidum]